MNVKHTQFQVVVWREEKHFVAQCLNVDVSSFGDTKEESLTNLKEALELYFEDGKDVQVSVIESAEVVPMALSYA